MIITTQIDKVENGYIVKLNTAQFVFNNLDDALTKIAAYLENANEYATTVMTPNGSRCPKRLQVRVDKKSGIWSMPLS